jgi:hypothetical protein
LANLGEYDQLSVEQNIPADYIQAQQVTMPNEDGTLTHIGALVREFGSGIPVRFGLWADSSNYPAGLLDYCNEHTSVEGRQEVAVVNGYSLKANTKYWVGWLHNTTNWRTWKENTGGVLRYKAQAYGALPDPFPSTADLNAWRINIYAVYTPVTPTVTGAGLSSFSFIAAGLAAWVKKQEELKLKKSAILEAISKKLGSEIVEYMEKIEAALDEIEI